MKKIFKSLIMIMLVFGSVLGGLLVSKEANAADYSFTPGTDGISVDENNNLVVDFTVTYPVPGSNMGGWVVYLFSPETQANFGYNSGDHKYYSSAAMGRNTAAYYFMTSNTSPSGHIKVTIAKDAIAYSGGNQDASYKEDYKDYNSGKTFAQVANEKNWYVSVGPFWKSPWAGASGWTYNVDCYIARGSELPDYSASVTFRDANGTEITKRGYSESEKIGNVITSGVNFTKDSNKIWVGWYCDTNKQTYAELSDIANLKVGDLMSKTSTVNFYATYQRGNGEYIEFTTIPNYEGNATQDSENDTLLLHSYETNRTFTVTYKITHNDGVNSLLLIPDYDTDKFEITAINVDETTSLGEATFTNGKFDKIALESNVNYGELNDSFMTITYRIKTPVDGDYEFGLKLLPYIHNEASEAFYYDIENLGEQLELDIRVISTQKLRIWTYRESSLEIEDDNVFTYAKQAVTTNRVNTINSTSDNLVVDFKYEGYAGESTIPFEIKWYLVDAHNDANNYNITKTLLESAPVNANIIDPSGDHIYYYEVEITAPQMDMYEAASARATFKINPRPFDLTVDNKSGDYLDAIKPLTYTINGILDGDTVEVTLTTEATATSNAGSYAINSTHTNSNYTPSSTSQTTGTYTINPKAITITALNQSATYTGEEPEVDQTKYTVSDNLTVSGVVITKAAGVNAGEYDLTPSLDNANYTVTAVKGKFTIESVGNDAEYIKLFFSGATVTYDFTEHDLLIVDANKPEWITYTPTGNVQINANTYTISIKVELDETTANNYTSGTELFNFTVEGKINPYAYTITAEDKSSEYGQTPLALTPTQVEPFEGDEVQVTYTLEVTAETPVGEYDIVPSATNSNYAFTFINGTYTVTKATAVITGEANNKDYNQGYDYTHSAKVNTLTLTGYSVVFTNANNDVVDINTVLDAGTYTMTVTVAGTDNYNGATESFTFTISKVELAQPTITYNKATATWEAVTKDANGKDLYNSTVTYKINDETVEGLTYTATSTDALTLNVSASNENYIAVSKALAAVYSITFTEGSHPLNEEHAANMPAGQFAFAGQTATQPEEVPTLYGYTFANWDFDFATEINANTEINATWTVVSFKVTFKYTEDAETLNTNVFEYQIAYKSNINYNELNLNPTKASDNAGISYTFKNWLNNELEYLANNDGFLANATEGEFIVTANATFVAQYNTVYNKFTVTYHVAYNGVYSEYQTAKQFAYNETIENYELSNNVKWFNADSWYANEARTQAAPTSMPNHNIDLYGAVVFNVGQGDVNGDGSVDANDITLYRQWIVGGYTMTIVEAGKEWTTAQSYNQNTKYFLMSVADNNTDNSKDIRDVSITRMALVGGYTWDREEGYNVTGQEIIRNVAAKTLNDVYNAINDGKKVTLANDITESTGNLNIITNKNICIDLNGHTLTLNSLDLESTSFSTIKVEKGTIVAENGITIKAPYGDVILSNLTGYDKDGAVNLAAANHSLHIYEDVEFRKGTKTESTLAIVTVADGTHFVIEEQANLRVETVKAETNAEISFTIKNSETELIAVDGNYTVLDTNNEVVEDSPRISGRGEVSTIAEFLKAVANNQRSIKLMGDIETNSDIVLSSDVTLNLNGHKITFAEWGLEVRDNATLTINGDGEIEAVEAPLYARRGGTLIVNGGTFTATNNFVIGTNGSAGQGGATIIVNGGTFNGSIVAEDCVACGIYLANQDTLTVNGGTFNITNGVGILSRSGNTTINGGTFNVSGTKVGRVGDSRVVIPAGNELVLDFKADYPGGAPTLTNNTTYNVYSVKDNAADEITFYRDMNYTSDIVYDKDMTLNLNGHKITFSGWGYEINNATLTINGDGEIKAKEAALYAQYAGKLVINGGTYTSTNNFVIGTNGTSGRGGNEITINGGTFNGSITEAGYIACGIYVANSDTVTVNAGTFYITNGVGIVARAGNTTIGQNVVINLTTDNSVQAGKVGDSQVNIEEPQYIVADFHSKYPGGYPTITNNTEYKVNALVDTEGSLNAANAFADEITLLANITLENQLTVTRTLTLNLNGHNINNTTNLWDKQPGSWSLISVNGGDLTINGNGHLNAKLNDCYAVDLRNEGKLVVNGGTFGGNISAIYVHDGSLTVNNGYFYIKQLNNGNNPYAFLLNCLDANYNNDTAKITVNGGQFENFDPSNCAAENYPTNFLGEGNYTVTPTQDGNNTIYTVTQNN